MFNRASKTSFHSTKIALNILYGVKNHTNYSNCRNSMIYYTETMADYLNTALDQVIDYTKFKKLASPQKKAVQTLLGNKLYISAIESINTDATKEQYPKPKSPIRGFERERGQYDAEYDSYETTGVFYPNLFYQVKELCPLIISALKTTWPSILSKNAHQYMGFTEEQRQLADVRKNARIIARYQHLGNTLFSSLPAELCQYIAVLSGNPKPNIKEEELIRAAFQDEFKNDQDELQDDQSELQDDQNKLQKERCRQSL